MSRFERYIPKRRRPKGRAQKKEHDAFERVSLAVGIAGLVVLIFYTGATFLQVSLLKQQISDAHTASADGARQTDRAIETSIANGATVAYQAALTDRALKLAEKNAGIAGGQLATAQDTERRQLRPYAYVVVDYVHDLVAGQTPTYLLHVGVVGLTPAHDLALKAYTSVKPIGARSLKPVKIPKGTVIGKTVLHPGTTIPQNGKFGGLISDQLARDIAADRSRAFVYGVIAYKDSFGQSYYTRFCTEYGGSASKVSGAEGVGRTCTIAYWNEAN